MAGIEQVFLYLGVYFEEQAASDDEGVLQDRHLAGAVGAYEATVISRGEDGHARIRESSGLSSWTGLSVIAIAELIFPSSAVELDVSDGARIVCRQQAAAVPARLRGFAAILNNGQSALAVIGDSTLPDALDRADLRAFRHIAEPIDLGTEANTLRRATGKGATVTNSYEELRRTRWAAEETARHAQQAACYNKRAARPPSTAIPSVPGLEIMHP